MGVVCIFLSARRKIESAKIGKTHSLLITNQLRDNHPQLYGDLDLINRRTKIKIAMSVFSTLFFVMRFFFLRHVAVWKVPQCPPHCNGNEFSVPFLSRYIITSDDLPRFGIFFILIYGIRMNNSWRCRNVVINSILTVKETIIER